MDILLEVGNRIKEFRKRAGLTQAKLAELTDMSINYVGLIERGKRSAAVDTLYRISKVLDVELKEIFDFPGHKSKRELAADELGKLLRHRSIDEIAMMKEVVGVLFKHKSRSK